jgi:hypothetical protein
MSENNCSNYGVPEAEQACQQFVETVANDPDSTGSPHITQALFRNSVVARCLLSAYSWHTQLQHRPINSSGT